MKIDKKLIKELVDNLKEFGLTELEYQEGQTKIKVSKNNVVLSNPAHSKNEKVVETSNLSAKNISGIQVTSPIIGTAYHAPEPGAKKHTLHKSRQPPCNAISTGRGCAYAF